MLSSAWIDDAEEADDVEVDSAGVEAVLVEAVAGAEVGAGAGAFFSPAATPLPFPSTLTSVSFFSCCLC